MSNQSRRWYDKDPLLKEAMELLSLSPKNTQDQAAEFILKLQEEVAADVIDRVYDSFLEYQGKGNRWYDNDPVMMKALELLKEASPRLQTIAAKKLLKVLTEEADENVISEKLDGLSFKENE